MNLLRRVCDTNQEMATELQAMLFMNVKCEIQMLNEFGDTSGYLDHKLRDVLGTGLGLRGKL